MPAVTLGALTARLPCVLCRTLYTTKTALHHACAMTPRIVNVKSRRGPDLRTRPTSEAHCPDGSPRRLAVRCRKPDAGDRGRGGHGLDAKTQCTHTTLYFTEPEPLGRSGCAYTLSELRARGHDTRHTHACYGTQIYIKCTAEIGAPRRLLRRNSRPHNPALARAFSTRPPAWHPAWRAAPSRRRAAAA